MKPCYHRVFIFLIMLVVTVGCSRSSNVRKINELVLKAPDSAESGDAIPLTLELPDYLESGGQIVIFANSEPAVTVKLFDGYKTSKFSTRVRMFNSGPAIVAVVSPVPPRPSLSSAVSVTIYSPAAG